MPELDADLIETLAQIISPLVRTTDDQQALVTAAFGASHELLNDLTFGGSAQTFIRLALQAANRYDDDSGVWRIVEGALKDDRLSEAQRKQLRALKPLVNPLAAPEMVTSEQMGEMLRDAQSFLNEGSYAAAAETLKQLQSAGFQSDLIDLGALLQKAEQKRQASVKYHEINLALSAGTPLEKVKEAWQAFRSQQGDFPDLLNLEGRIKAAILGGVVLPINVPLLEFLPIPEGRVLLEKGRVGTTYSPLPIGNFSTAAFQISKYLVTNAQFDEFVNAPDGYRMASWWNYSAEAKAWRTQHPNPEPTAFAGTKLPRTNVTWYEAVAFCQWLTHRVNDLGVEIRLPTEPEWQFAAQGERALIYPFGSVFDKARCNTSESGEKKATAVDRYRGTDSQPRGESPFKTLDMAGNVWEWCLNPVAIPDSLRLEGTAERAIRGGSFFDPAEMARCARRASSSPDRTVKTIGFRLALFRSE
ncbi:MAG: SUMF1/EgtB/PvdO family nonheme iron enzyme [Anaerolinea sp.]|nr:SUMF1/EgtB/PvdO family nonheme iron enzyme [Anaerolinea sp.]